METRIIGIDFGTSTTVVRVHNAGKDNKIIPVTINGQRIIPTIAFRPEGSEEMYYGYDAQSKIESNAKGKIYRNFKMNLLSDDEEVRNDTEKLISGFMKYVYTQYNKNLNDGIFEPAEQVKVYVSHPAKWNSYARNLMKESVVNAGFCSHGNVALKDEPTAAFLAVVHEKEEELKKDAMLHEGKKYRAMMIDMGAGTTDIVLCTYMVKGGRLHLDDIFTYPPMNAPGLCGGREIDDALLTEVEKFVDKMMGKPTDFGKKVVRKMGKRIKTWKEQEVYLILKNEMVLPEPDEIAEFRETLQNFGAPVMNQEERFAIDRKSYERLSRVHWEQWVDLLKGAFKQVAEPQYADLDCPKSPEEVELLIVTGGHSQWYVVSEYLKGEHKGLPEVNFTRIRKNPALLVQSVDPQETVAVGLCHLDEDVVGTLAAANDVTIIFSYAENKEDKVLGRCELVKKGMPLPYENQLPTIKNTIKGNFIFRKEIVITYSIVTDGINIITKKNKMIPSSGVLTMMLKTVFSAIGIALLDVPRFMWALITGNIDKLDNTVIQELVDHNYVIQLTPKININEEGITTIGAKIEIDDAEENIPETII